MDPDETDANSYSALMCAAYGGHEAVARLLLEASADNNMADNDGWTALLSASYGGHLGVARLLLASGADKTTTTA